MIVGMKSAKRRTKIASKIEQPVWLPIDIRLVPPTFQFSHAKGVARVFLILEMVLTTIVVVGTLLLVLIKVFW